LIGLRHVTPHADLSRDTRDSAACC
jgi:hypothetical protein